MTDKKKPKKEQYSVALDSELREPLMEALPEEMRSTKKLTTISGLVTELVKIGFKIKFPGIAKKYPRIFN